MNQINFNCPGFFTGFPIYQAILDLQKNVPEVFHDNIYKISDREYEIVYNSKFDLDYQIIDFLSNPKLSYIDIYRVTDKNLSDIETCKVTIYKINEYKFRMFLLTSL